MILVVTPSDDSKSTEEPASPWLRLLD